MAKLSDALRDARAQKGLTYADVVKLSEKRINPTYISKIENEDMIPSPKKIRVLADVYRLDYLELLLLAGHVRKGDLSK